MILIKLLTYFQLLLVVLMSYKGLGEILLLVVLARTMYCRNCYRSYNSTRWSNLSSHRSSMLQKYIFIPVLKSCHIFNITWLDGLPLHSMPHGWWVFSLYIHTWTLLTGWTLLSTVDFAIQTVLCPHITLDLNCAFQWYNLPGGMGVKNE